MSSVQPDPDQDKRRKAVTGFLGKLAWALFTGVVLSVAGKLAYDRIQAASEVARVRNALAVEMKANLIRIEHQLAVGSDRTVSTFNYVNADPDAPSGIRDTAQPIFERAMYNKLGQSQNALPRIDQDSLAKLYRRLEALEGTRLLLSRERELQSFSEEVTRLRSSEEYDPILREVRTLSIYLLQRWKLR